jgi:hypothetical protein
MDMQTIDRMHLARMLYEYGPVKLLQWIAEATQQHLDAQLPSPGRISDPRR